MAKDNKYYDDLKTPTLDPRSLCANKMCESSEKQTRHISPKDPCPWASAAVPGTPEGYTPKWYGKPIVSRRRTGLFPILPYLNSL